MSNELKPRAGFALLEIKDDAHIKLRKVGEYYEAPIANARWFITRGIAKEVGTFGEPYTIPAKKIAQKRFPELYEVDKVVGKEDNKDTKEIEKTKKKEKKNKKS